MGSASLQPNQTDSFRIKRKPVSNPNLRGTVAAHSAVLPPLPSYKELYGPVSQETQEYTPQRPLAANPSSVPSISTPSPTPPLPSHSPTPVQKAYGEARHFLGGLISHPTEGNRHITILRHSHGLVFYRGNSTSVAVSIFADTPLPSNRTLWLQCKGWTGKTGMRAKSLFRLRNDWMNVTPEMPLRADQVNPNDERAWQRDIKKLRKNKGGRFRDNHQLRETAVVRIPVEAGDGYFQLVLCQGSKEKVIGNSPVFRVASVSTSPTSFRGASLSTLPLEVGALVVSLYAQAAVQTVAAPITAAIQSKLDPYSPSWVTETAALTAYSVSGVQDRLGNVLPESSSSRQGLSSIPSQNGTTITEGPQSPYPMMFKARGKWSHTITPGDTTKLSLTKLPDWVLEDLRGYFFGWARVDVSSGKESSIGWCPVILSVRDIDPLSASRVDMSSHASKKVVTLRLLEEVQFQSDELEVCILGFLRADVPPPTGTTHQELVDAQAAASEAALLADSYDASLVEDILSHPVWAPNQELIRKSSWKDRTMEACSRGKKLVEQVPLHRLGVRSVTDEMRENQVTMNGFYIVR